MLQYVMLSEGTLVVTGGSLSPLMNHYIVIEAGGM